MYECFNLKKMLLHEICCLRKQKQKHLKKKHFFMNEDQYWYFVFSVTKKNKLLFVRSTG